MIHDPDFEEPVRQPHEAIEHQSTTGAWLTIIATFVAPVLAYFMTGFADDYLAAGHPFFGGIIALIATSMILVSVALFMLMISTVFWTEIFEDIKQNNIEFASMSKKSREKFLKSCKEKY
ncbi:hypothetical protein [Cronobacter phage vB_Cdu_VP8]|nr:hypothetical protein [Cronobacter phage vB_Cdu_VP8]